MVEARLPVGSYAELIDFEIKLHRVFISVFQEERMLADRSDSSEPYVES